MLVSCAVTRNEYEPVRARREWKKSASGGCDRNSMYRSVRFVK